jgi:hypothetical protein
MGFPFRRPNSNLRRQGISPVAAVLWLVLVVVLVMIAAFYTATHLAGVV